MSRVRLFEVVSLIGDDRVKRDALFTQYKNAEKYALYNTNGTYPTMIRKIFIHKESANYRSDLYTIVISRKNLFYKEGISNTIVDKE